jgi:hypothetical protein
VQASQDSSCHVKMNVRERGLGGMDRIDLSKDMDQWRALVNTVMTFWVP